MRVLLLSPFDAQCHPEMILVLAGIFSSHIPHLLAHESPCSAHLKSPLAFGSVNLFVVCPSNENGNQTFLDGIELWSYACMHAAHFQWMSQCLSSLSLISRARICIKDF